MDNNKTATQPAYILKSEVVTGMQRGRKLGFPTANLKYPDNPKIEYGVYASIVVLPDNSQWLSVTNVGVPMTFNEKKPQIDIYLLDYSGTLYGQLIQLNLITKIRDVIKFNSAEELKDQINLDIEKAKYILQNVKLD